MIVNFSIRNFRSIKDEVTLSFEPENSKNLEDYYIIEPISGFRLLKLGLIYGANGSGKTTILNALEFLRNLVIIPLEKKNEFLNFKPFLFDDDTIYENSELKLEFLQNGIKYRYEVIFNVDSIVNEKLFFYKPNKALIYERNTDVEKQLTSIEFGSKIKINKIHKATLEANTLWNNTVLGGFLKTNFESIELKDVTIWFETKLQELVTPKTSLVRLVTDKLESRDIEKEDIIKLLGAADFKINDILIQKEQGSFDTFNKEIQSSIADSGEFAARFKFLKDSNLIEKREIFFQHTIERNGRITNYIMPFNEESQGTQRYYQFSGLLALMIKSKSIFSIDELESSLHPDLLRHFLLIFLVNSKQSQLIATTHHRELLMDRDMLRDDVIWFTEKKEDGSMDLYALSDFDSSIVRDTTSIYNTYKSGKLGAVPELGDYYLDFTNGEK